MNEQNSDSFSTEASTSSWEVPKTPPIISKEHRGIADILGKFLHHTTSKKITESSTATSALPNTPSVPTTLLPDAPNAVMSQTDAVAKKSHLTIVEKIAHIFHKKTSTLESEKGIDVHEAISSSSSWEASKTEETPFVIDERFARLLEQDSTYHSMVRSEDIKNIQLQLSMRYMLLMLAIFVVIAWVVNNRVIMFWFSDFPLLARTRDALFALLTGLFSLTVWTGSHVWFRHRVGVIVLQTLAIVIFITVLISIYLPFWR